MTDPETCPYIVTSNEGTSYCDLAESSVIQLMEKNRNLRYKVEYLERIVAGRWQFIANNPHRAADILSGCSTEPSCWPKEVADRIDNAIEVADHD